MSSSPRVFVGRERELAAIDVALADAESGRGSLFLLVGEPGIGKTRLADEVTRRARERGCSTHWGRCWEVGGAPAFWPWIQILRALAREGGRCALETKVRSDVTDLVRELGGVRADGGATDLAQGRFRLFDGVATALRDAAASAPRVLFLDDLHAADPSSLALLLFVARELRDTRLVVVGTYRDQEARLVPALGAMLASIAREGTSLLLRRFDREEVKRLVDQRSGAPGDDALLAAVLTTTEGHPLFVDEVLGAMAPRGERRKGDSLPVPETVRDAIRQRLARIDGAARAPLEAAAVLGREMSALTLASMLDATPDALREQVRAAVAADVLVELDPETLAFSHALVRDAIYRDIPAETRGRLHARAAGTLERDGAPEAGLGEVANHLLEAVDVVGVERALDGVLRAAARASRVFAFEDAAAILARAVATLEGRIDDPRRLGDVLVRLGEAQVRSQADGTPACARAAEIARRTGDAELLGRAGLALGAEIVPSVINATLVGMLEDALRLLPPSPSGLRARVLARLAGALQPARDPHGPIAIAREAIAMARALGDETTLRVVLHGAGSALVDYADPAERLEVDDETLRHALAAGDAPLAFRAHMRLFFDHLELGSDAQAALDVTACERMCVELKRPRYAFYVRMLGAVRASHLGRFEEADELARQAEALAARAGDPALERTCAFHRFGTAFVRQDPRAIAKEAANVRATFPLLPDRAAWIEAMFAVVAAHEGDFAKAHAHLAAVPADSPVVTVEPTAMFLLAEARILSGFAEGLAPLLAGLEAYRSRFLTGGIFLMFALGPCTALLAGLEALRGRFDEAARDYENALARCTAAGARPARARTLLDYAGALAGRAPSRGDRARAAALVTESETLARELGMEALALRARALGARLADVAPPPAAVAPATPSFALAREGETWKVSRGATVFRLKDSRGLAMLAKLVAEPGREQHVLTLGARGGGDARDLGDAGNVLDAQAAKAYRARLEHLRDEEQEAERLGDAERGARARGEIAVLAQQLAQGLGLGGRGRKAAAAVERARSNVQRRLKDAIRRIEENDRELGRFLGWTVRTGTYCVYDPAGTRR